MLIINIADFHKTIESKSAISAPIEYREEDEVVNLDSNIDMQNSRPMLYDWAPIEFVSDTNMAMEAVKSSMSHLESKLEASARFVAMWDSMQHRVHQQQVDMQQVVQDAVHAA